MASWKNYIEYLIYFSLLFVIVPIRIEERAKSIERFDKYLKEFNKTYDNQTEYYHKLKAFEQSLNNINLLNSKRKHDKMALYGLTKYSDLYPEEFVAEMLEPNLIRNLTKNDHQRRHHRSLQDLKIQKIDWRERHVITKIKNQKNCGACWAFTATESIESMYAIKTGRLIEFSVQQLIDCVGYGNNGCSGGDIYSALEWIHDYKINIEKESDYPLNLDKSHEGCLMNSNLNRTGFQLAEVTNERLVGYEEIILQLLVKNGPVAVAVNAINWQNYVGGVIQYHCDGGVSYLNHAVQIVGYDLTAEIPYYIVRNTWGEDYGDNGYLYLAINQNICGLANEVVAITLL